MSKKSPKIRRKDERGYRINILPALSTKCFVCDEHIQGKSVHLVMGRTQYSNSTYPSKIGELVGDDFMVVVCMEDVLCGKCANLLNHLDKLETDLRVVRRTLTGYLASKYNINHDDLFAKFERGGVCEKTPKLTEAFKSAPKVYRCELCEFSTTNKNEVVVHVEECMKLPHSCALCPKRFSSIKDHARHAVIMHKLTWSCQICSSLFVSERNVADHMKCHPRCSVCNSAFADQTQVDDHTRKEHKPKTQVVIEKKKDIVEACLEELANDHDSSLNVLAEDTTDIEFHTCSICALTFLKASLFNEHIKMHENSKQDTCQIDSSAMNSADVCRVEDDLENLFEKLHAETDDSTKLEKCLPNGVIEPPATKADPAYFLFNAQNVSETQTMSGIRDEFSNQSSQATKNVSADSTKRNGDNLKSLEKDHPLKNVTKKEQCCVCLKVFLSKHKLRSHLDIHLENDNCKCSVCDELVSGQALIEHCRKHFSEKTNSAKCRFCSLTFMTKRLSKAHEKTHADTLAFACSNCDRRFSTKVELSEHEDRLHRADSHCRYCGKKIDNLEALRSHERRHTNLPENFPCNVCQRAFKTKTGLRHHTAVHTGQFKYCCDFCGVGFMSRVVFEEHRSKHTKEERYVCDVCGRKFSFQSTYWIHRKWHDNPYPYKCNFCGKSFRHTSLLAVHKRKHTGERPYKCPHCPLTFPVGTSLKRHVILHTGAYPFKCQDCDKGFTTKDKYSLHRAKVHGDYDLMNRKSLSKDLKMAVRETGVSEAQVDTVDSWELVDGVNLELVLGEGAEREAQRSVSVVADASTLALPGTEGLSSGSRIIEIVMDDSYQAVATVTLAGVTDSEGVISEAWYN